MMSQLKIVNAVFVMVLVFSSVSYAKSDISIFIRDDVYDNYRLFLGGKTPLAITNFSDHYIRRDVVDMIIAQKALALGGFTREYTYHKGNINFSNIKLLQGGQLLISFDSVWLADAKRIEKDVYISDPVIRKGEYFAGVYTSPQNEKALGLNHFSDFKTLSAVSSPRWLTDWKTLSDLPLKKLFAEDEWLSQARMVSMQWVDFIMMPLIAKDANHFKLADIDLVAVPNILLLLDDSRHFVISKKHPEGKAAFEAIQKGLTILSDKHAIEKAYREAGFIPNLNDHTIINKLSN